MYFCNNFDGFSEKCLGFREIENHGLPLVLNSERGEVVKALADPEQRLSSADKASTALRNHCEAERRRRERINGHLSTLRTIIPGSDKMDKAGLLAEVVNQLKELNRTVAEATKGMLVPTDTDELKVEQEAVASDGKTFSIRASLCCDFNHEILRDIRDAIEALPSKTVRAEIATLGSRMVNVFVIAGCNEEGENLQDGEESQFLLDCVHKSLLSVLEKFRVTEDFCRRNTASRKRRREYLLGSSNPSSLGEMW